MTRTEFNELVINGAMASCYPSTTDWLADRSDNGRAVLSQWYLELSDLAAEDCIEAIEAMHIRRQGPDAYDRESWPGYILRHVAKVKEAKRARTEWRQDPVPAWALATGGSAQAAFRKVCEILEEERQRGTPASDLFVYGRDICPVLRRRHAEWSVLLK